MWSSVKEHTSHRSVPPPTLSFLFVVNCPILSEQYKREYSKDRWGIILPPTKTSHFAREGASPVFRYKNGRVTRASEYVWHRNPGTEGGIILASQIPTLGGSIHQTPYMLKFATCTVFRGCPFRPIIYMERDALAYDVNEIDIEQMYHPLSFGMYQSRGGVSMAGARMSFLHAVGRDAAWVGKLVPDSYKNPSRAAPDSGGLAGSLPVILGLMALSQIPGHEAEAFDRGLWVDGTWSGPDWSYNGRSPTGADDLPRGVVVHVCCDEVQNPHGSTIDSIQRFCDDGIIVQG
ncbi:hypothetical protein M406DRAFT_326520 [Cryphonectria parasitica EP155]|uniref:Uncharacterized protein n=1 Tax=Cryphonectria parasitica (strain ATCC 38755 / EP155) TaxID=660469 RepID=A0A9P4YD07_CRYP1|nr:uncharacterized protein M406DRAFT_326520 [Cryphonectria parasitica EP155]KAF3771121.1 hypothetical protein M406DRAFT_326520 [Cryphonectria parasitica EP155]